MAFLASNPTPTLYVETYQNYVGMERVELLDMVEGLDGTPAVLRFSVPPDPEGPLALLQNTRVALTIANEYAFCGRVRLVQRRGSGTERTVEVTALDARHELGGRVVGQYGVGELPDIGGWHGVGYMPEFNPEGRPNRSLYSMPIAPATGVRCEGVYRFVRPGMVAVAAPSTVVASYWLNADVLKWLLNWYCDDLTMTFDPAVFDAHEPLQRRCTIGDLAQQPLTQAITTLLRSIGMRWTIRYDQRNSNTFGTAQPVGVFTLIGADVSAPRTLSLYIPPLTAVTPPTGQEFVTAQPALLVSQWQTEDNTIESADRTEVHADPDIYQTTWSCTGAPLSDLLVEATSDKLDYAHCWVQNFDGMGLDTALASCFPTNAYAVSGATPASEAEWRAYYAALNSVPVRWLSRLLPVNSDGTAATWTLDPDTDSSPRAIENIFIKSTSGGVPDWTRVKSGAQVDFDAGRIYLKNRVVLHSTTPNASEDSDRDVTLTAAPQIRFTVAAVLPLHRVSASQPNPVFSGWPMTRLLRIRRLSETLCREATVNTVASTSRGTGVVLHAGTNSTVIHDISTELADRLADLIAAESLTAVRHSGTFTLPHAHNPALQPHVGDAIAFAAYNPGMPETGCRVVSCRLDLESMEYTIAAVDAFL